VAIIAVLCILGFVSNLLISEKETLRDEESKNITKVERDSSSSSSYIAWRNGSLKELERCKLEHSTTMAMVEHALSPFQNGISWNQTGAQDGRHTLLIVVPTNGGNRITVLGQCRLWCWYKKQSMIAALQQVSRKAQLPYFISRLNSGDKPRERYIGRDTLGASGKNDLFLTLSYCSGRSEDFFDVKLPVFYNMANRRTARGVRPGLPDKIAWKMKSKKVWFRGSIQQTIALQNGRFWLSAESIGFQHLTDVAMTPRDLMQKPNPFLGRNSLQYLNKWEEMSNNFTKEKMPMRTAIQVMQFITLENPLRSHVLEVSVYSES